MTNLVCFIVDGWQAGCCGWLGNAWIATPALDELACRGLVLDQALVESPRVEDAYRAWWEGRPAVMAGPRESNGVRPFSLPGALRAFGYETALVTDDAVVAGHPRAADFEHAPLVPELLRQSPAERWEETQLARGTLAALKWLPMAEAPFFLWIHLRGPAAVWDAPLEYRDRYFDAAVKLDHPIVAPPSMQLADDFDPDDRAAIRWSYAAQVALIDQAVAVLVDALQEQRVWESTALCVTSPRGFALGEHRWVGQPGQGDVGRHRVLHEETLHVPWLLRRPGDQGALARSTALVQPIDLPATLLDLAAVGDRGALHPSAMSVVPLADEVWAQPRDRILFSYEQERAIRTPSWFLRWSAASELSETSQPPEPSEPAPADGAAAAEFSPPQLYVKPDDRCEVNDVADRCAEFLDPLREAFDATARALAAGAPPVPLDEELITCRFA